MGAIYQFTDACTVCLSGGVTRRETSQSALCEDALQAKRMPHDTLHTEIPCRHRRLGRGGNARSRTANVGRAMRDHDDGWHTKLYARSRRGLHAVLPIAGRWRRGARYLRDCHTAGRRCSVHVGRRKLSAGGRGAGPLVHIHASAACPLWQYWSLTSLAKRVN